jgi:ring-1,2-phenylacetyl-CoA epoxidase subunit PaaE
MSSGHAETVIDGHGHKRRVKRGWMNLRVTKIVHDTHDTDTLFLEDADEGGRQFDYVAGQYLTFRFDDLAPKPIVRSYTMSSSPIEPDFSAVTVKRVDKGLVSNWLCDAVKVGTVLRARGPMGKFCYEPEKDARHLVMVAGGSGVTPFVSIIREYAGRLGAPDAPAKMTLLVSHRSAKDLICNEALEAAKRPGVEIVTTLSREDLTQQGFLHGRIDDAMLGRVLGETYAPGRDATYMTCGPKAIMDATVAHLGAKNVPAARVKTESFDS